MSGLLYDFSVEGIDQTVGRLTGLTELEFSELAFNLGALLESSTKRRIDAEKQAPDGEAWVPWSEAYDETRGEQHSLLVGENDLLESVQNYSTGSTVEVGTPLIYGAIHQFGGADVESNIPARPYLGMSEEDARAIETLVLGEAREALQ